ncbi:hypothetical protein MOQ_008904 [Trypanosoma cruzi marinkellei]|uniref:Uncharacterized protein n=1 Tax=Trypanosoma cruzi marinkellei TaxID=85056 RepID=K2MJM8_TRYCR|nr:hypothetical protein MOQ_008904 [Trypanosoma cruzi marinkellei]
MQRPKNKNAFGESYARQNDMPLTGRNSVSAAFFPQEDAGAMGDVFYSQRCHRCKRVFQFKSNAAIFKYTCWRCGCPVCRNCRTPWPHAVDMWACTSCVRPISFIWLFQTTYHGVDLLLRVLEFCDPRSTRIVKFLFPAAALQCIARRETPAKQPASRCETPKRRLLLVKASDGAGVATGSSGAQRRVLVEHSPRRLPLRQHPTQRMARAKTAIKRYSPPQEHHHHQQQQQQHVRGYRARTPNGMSSYSPPKRFSLSDYKLNTTTTSAINDNNNKGGVFFSEFQAPTKVAVKAHVERNELSAEARRPMDEGSGNRFLRIDATKKVGGRVDMPRIDCAQPTSTPSVSGSRSDSPPPRFPSFSQFLDDRGTALVLEEQHSPQPQQHDPRGVERQTGGRANNTSKVFEVREKEVEVVELGTRRESRISTCTGSPNPVTPRPSRMGGTTVTGGSSNKKKGICSPPPHLGIISLNASLSMSQRRHVTNGGRPYAATPVATTTARATMANHSMTPVNHGIHSSYSIASHRRMKATTDNNMISNAPMHFKLHASRGPTTGSSIPTRVTSPRPFASVSSTFGGVVPVTERHLGAASFGNHCTTAHYPRTRMTINLKTDNFRLQRMTSNITSPRFARRPTVHTPMTSGSVPISARAPPASQVGTRSMITSPRTARPPEKKKSKVRGNIPPSCSQTPLMRKNSPPHSRNVTPRGSHARTPLQRIASSRLLPSGEAARRYLPTQADAGGREPQMASPPVMMIHLTRQRGTLVPNLTEDKTPRPACIPQPTGKEQPEQQYHALSVEPRKE